MKRERQNESSVLQKGELQQPNPLGRINSKGLPQPREESALTVVRSEVDIQRSGNLASNADFTVNKLFYHTAVVDALVKGDTLKSYPISVSVYLTGTCNLKCPWCVDRSLRESETGCLDVQALLRILSEFKAKGVKAVVLEGGGEPTVHPHFRQIVQGIREVGLDVGLITNGVLLDKYLDLVQCFAWIRVSLDATDPAEYVANKGMDRFHRVIQNLRSAAQVKDQCVLGVGFVITKWNYSEAGLRNLVRSLRELGVDYFQVRPVTEADEIRLDARNGDISYLKEYETDHFRVYIHQFSDFALDHNREGNGGLPCIAHGVTTTIAQNGDVLLCGRLHHRSGTLPTIGSIYRQSAEEIWEGQHRKTWTERVSNGAFCQENCPECRITKYNFLLAGIMRSQKTANFV